MKDFSGSFAKTLSCKSAMSFAAAEGSPPTPAASTSAPSDGAETADDASAAGGDGFLMVQRRTDSIKSRIRIRRFSSGCSKTQSLQKHNRNTIYYSIARLSSRRHRNHSTRPLMGGRKGVKLCLFQNIVIC